jgi:carboxyl-terminal processing protease
VVVNPVPNGPGERAGILTGDRIVQIDGKVVSGWTSEEVQRLLRGAPGSTVKLTIEHAGSAQPVTLTLTRAAIHHSAVKRAALLPNHVGYVALSVFSDSTAREVASAVDSLVRAGATSLMLDLRGNPGGLLDQGVSVADLFLDKGQRIASTRGRDSSETITFTDSTPQRWPHLTMAVLIDDKTASAAEVVAGALQDHDRAAIIGETSYGKGLVQRVFPISSGAVRLTTARWLTPAGRMISREQPQDPDQIPDSEPVRPKFKTDDGRTVLGGGGITPDLTVGDTTIPPENLAFMRALGTHVAQFHDALTALALDFKARRTVTSPDFVVTPAMQDSIYRAMQQRGADVPRAIFDAASPLVARLFAYEVDRYVFGADAEFLRKATDDKVMIAAQRLLTASRDQRDALKRAAAEQNARPRG